MNESSCCGNNKTHSAGAPSDKKQSCCNNEHTHTGKASSCCDSEPMSANAVVDPVCGMKVDATTTTLYVEHKGKKYYFCNIACRDSFVSDPEKYLSKTL
jgi:Cu+-exporting ATPase